MPEVRWPIHPSPSAGESLSSWLGRIASVYGIGLVELLDHLDPRSVGITDFDTRYPDIDPPARLIRAIEARTGCGRFNARSTYRDFHFS